MKANRKFKEDSEAVSAVIGVILMVAITVAIAATVYYYVTTMMPSGEESTPQIVWSVDQVNNQVTITQGASGFDYSSGANTEDQNLMFRASNASGTGDLYISATWVLVDSGSTGSLIDSTEITAGDVITGLQDDTDYTVLWIPSNKAIGTITMN